MIKVENRIKHNLEMMVRYFGKFMDGIEEYNHQYRNDKEKLAHLNDILADNNPFNKDLMEILYGLCEYEENIKENLKEGK